MSARIRFVTGTDTGVGKTVACAALAAEDLAGGSTVTYFKPVQTGVAPGQAGDAQFLERVAGVRAVEGLRFPDPLAPAVAAEQVDQKVDVDALLTIAFDEARQCDELIVEGAGGLLVPLSHDTDMAGFAGMLDAQLVVVTRPSLGTLNHTALTLEVAGRRGLDPVLIVCDWPAEPGATETTNLERLKDMAPVMGLVAHIDDLDVESGDPPGVLPTIVPV